MNTKAKFWLFFLLGICIYIPFFLFCIMVQFLLGAISFLGCFLVYCYFLYRFVYKRREPEYPMVPPEGRMDVYFPRTRIPRPIHEDVRRYPEFFGKKKKRYKRTRRVKKKT